MHTHTAISTQDDDEREVLRCIMSNSRLSEHFLALARDLDVLEPKAPEDVYKSHLAGACVQGAVNHSTGRTQAVFAV